MMKKVNLAIMALLLIMIDNALCQIGNPDYFWDFTKVSTLGGNTQVFEQMTKDERLSFGAYAPRTQYCTSSYPDNQMTYPQRGPDGMFFKYSTDSMRLETVRNLGHGNKFMIAMWIKLHPYNGINYNNCYYRTLLKATRYDVNSYVFYEFTHDCTYINGNNRMAFSFNIVARSTSGNYGYFYNAMNQNITLDQVGWYLVSAAVDSSSSIMLNVTTRVRGPWGLYDTKAFAYGYYSLDESIMYNTNKTDMYIGGSCIPSPGNGYFANGAIFTIGRLYFWKNYANLNDQVKFDRFFFRKNGALTSLSARYVMPITNGKINCSTSIVGYPFPSTSTNNLTLDCITNTVPDSDIYWASWDFDDASNTMNSQFILDQSGNGYHMQKDPVYYVGPNEVFRIYGQGIMYYNLVYSLSVRAIPFDILNQFTVECWARKILTDSSIYSAVDSFWTFAPLVTYSSSNVLYYITVDGIKNLSTFVMRNNTYGSQKTFSNGIFSTSKWYFFSWAFSQQAWGQQRSTYSIQHQVDQQIQLDSIEASDMGSNFQWTNNTYYRIGPHTSTIILKSLKIYKYAKLTNDDADTSIYSGASCQAQGNQGACDICPRETGVCLSRCPEKTYGSNCLPCHPMCGHCKGPNLSDCVYCNRNGSLTYSFFSQTFGNCTCSPGRYYNTSLNSCELCDPNCATCYGPLYTQCLSCVSTKYFFNNTVCATTCQDPVILNNQTLQQYYGTTENINSVSVRTCKKCHLYCSVCSGSSNTQCSACNTGYFLQNTSVCYSTCPNGYYPDTATKTCLSCHSSCKTCTGPASNQCITCSVATNVQQDGVCQSSCNTGYFATASRVCSSCDSACKTCTGTGTEKCPSCNTGYYLQWLSTTCLKTCPDGFYKDNSTNSCLQCHYSCNTCTGGGPDTCVKCTSGYLKRGSYCVTQCSDGEFEINGECKSCSSKCSSCYGTLDSQCYTCAENALTGLGYYYLSESCLTKCPDGFYPDNLRRVCLKCPSTCATCISATYCTSCIYGPYQLNNGECTYFTCLDTQYRSIKPSLSCFGCDSSCLTCQGFSKFDCLTCRSQDKFLSQQCLSCDQQPGMTYPSDGSSNSCVEICGDGFNYGQVQCDDGNLINGDGCSSKCVVESGFNCTSGSKFSPSVCMDNQNPTPRISLIGSDNSVYISFDEEVYLQQTLSTSNVLIEVSGPQGTYKFDWLLKEEYKTTAAVQLIAFQMDFYTSLKGSQQETVKVQFLSDALYTDATGNGIVTIPLTSYLNKYDYIDPATKASLDSASSTSIMATYGVVALNLVISQLFGGSIAAMWTMVNTLQLMSLLPLCNVPYPTIVVMVLQKMLTTHGESTMIPNVPYTYLIDRSGSSVKLEKALNSRFSDYGWEISNFLYLSGRKIVLWTTLIIVYPFVWYMKRKYADKHKLCRPWVKIEQKFRYTLLLRGVIMSYVSMYLAFLLGIFKMNLTTMENSISAFAAIAFGILLTYLPILLMNILQRNYEKIETEKFMIQYSTIVKEVDLSHPIRYMYYPVFLIRRALFAIELVIFADQPKQQIGVMAFTALAMIIYVVVIKPQADRTMMILTALGEGVIMFLHVYSLVFLQENLTDEKANNYGWFMLITIGIYIISNWIIIIKLTIAQLKQKWRDYKQKKIDTKKQQEQDKEYYKWKKKRQIKQVIKAHLEREHMLNIIEQKQNARKLRFNENVGNGNEDFEDIHNLPQYNSLRPTEAGYLLSPPAHSSNMGNLNSPACFNHFNFTMQPQESARAQFLNPNQMYNRPSNMFNSPFSPQRERNDSISSNLQRKPQSDQQLNYQADDNQNSDQMTNRDQDLNATGSQLLLNKNVSGNSENQQQIQEEPILENDSLDETIWNQRKEEHTGQPFQASNQEKQYNSFRQTENMSEEEAEEEKIQVRRNPHNVEDVGFTKEVQSLQKVSSSSRMNEAE